MKQLTILTNRYFNKHPVWHLAYEWEDGFSQTLNIEIINRKFFAVLVRVTYQIGRLRLPINLSLIYEWIDDLYTRNFNKSIALRIDMYPRTTSYLGLGKKQVIPYIIDFDRNVSLQDFKKVYEGHKLILISSYNALNYLESNRLGLNVKHLPLSLPDKYQLTRETFFGEREFDLILPGRPNKQILAWLAKFEQVNPEFEYLSYEHIDNRHVYVSNKGKIVDCRTRDAYFSLLRKCNIAVYSTQGVDGNAKSFDHITAKLFEAISSGCLMIGLYPETDESIAFRVADICPSIFSYDDFSDTLLKYVDFKRCEDDLNHYIEFIGANRTSNVAKHLASIVNSSGFEDLSLLQSE